MNGRYYVYSYLDLEFPGRFSVNTFLGEFVFQYKPFYIGKGRGDRMVYHEKSCQNQELFNKINLGTYETQKIKENLSNFESHQLENELIYKIGRKNLGKGPLINHGSGIKLPTNKNIDISPLNLELNKYFLLIKSLNKNKFLKEAAKDLQISVRTLYRLIEDYSLIESDGEWIQGDI